MAFGEDLIAGQVDGVDGSVVAAGLENVLRDIDEHGAGAAAGGDVESFVNDLRKLLQTFFTMKLCLVAGRVMPKVSASWKASLPMSLEWTWPVMATMGMESIMASTRPVTRLVAPGPEVAQQTPTLPVARA